MARNLHKTHISICAFIILAFSLSVRCPAQTPDNSLVDTPSQRWLPPPNPTIKHPDSQTKFLSQLRDRLLSSEQNKGMDAPRLSDAQVKSLMEAMRRLSDNLPEGLTADSLDAIPPDLISNALTDPELMRQAKELGEKYSKIDRSKSAGDQRELYDSATNKLSPTKPDTDENLKPAGRTPRTQKQTDAPGSNKIAKGDNLRDLIEKLQNTQQRFAESQNPTGEATPQENLNSVSGLPVDDNKVSTSQGPAAGPKQTSTTGKPGTKQPGTRQSDSVPTSTKPTLTAPSIPAPPRSAPPRSAPPRIKPSPAGNEPSAENRSRQRSPTTDMNRQPDNRPLLDSDPLDSKSGEQQKPPYSIDRSATAKNNEPSSQTSIDVKKELQRRGFGPTLQKLVEEAQRKSQALQANTKPPTRPSNEIPKQSVAPDASNRSTRASNSPRPAEPTPRPAAPDSAFAKGLQETGKFLNSLWLQIAKNDQGPASVWTPPSPAAQSSAPREAFSLPNPFNARTLEYLVVLGALGSIAFFFLRFQSRSEQQRKDILESQMAPKINEIRTRDDVVRAFHALAKQRLKPVQDWWTCGYVINRFELTLPEYTHPIRTLAGLYQQARYLPSEHNLTSDQIEDAKFALKQCKG